MTEGAPPDSGLTEDEVRRRQASEGPNEIAKAKHHGVWSTIWGVVSEPMLSLLIVAGGIYLVLGEHTDAIVLLSSIAIIVLVTIYQENKTERALESLRELADPHATVVRDGVRRRVPRSEVVRGDLLLVGEGERVAADALVLEALELQADESLLTGESVPVSKVKGTPGEERRPPGEGGSSHLYAGTLVVRGSARAVVVAIGAQTEFGRIGESLRTLQAEPTLLQRDSRRLVRGIAVAAMVLCASVALLSDLRFSSWVEGLLAGVTLAMALIPEEIPLVLTIFLALGAWRIGQKHVLTRRFAAIEGLGSATVLCVDKTGTLTENRMAVAEAWVRGGGRWTSPLPAPGSDPQLSGLLGAAVLSSDPEPVDPMERALYLAADGTVGASTLDHDGRRGAAARGWRELLRRYPLGPDHLRVTQVWGAPGGGRRLAASKGAPESIADLCHLGPSERASVLSIAEEMASGGLRVLGVADGDPAPGALPEADASIPFRFLGLLALADPVRAEAPRAVKLCHRAGIRVVMITGDYPVTARAIARTIGLPSSDKVLTGEEISRWSDPELARRIAGISVCARVRPEQKLRIVRALQSSGEVVAMTGDGVNDAPALRAANIGVAMGERGTDVAREAAGLVLLTDSFPAMVEAVKEGRTIYDNVRKAVSYLLAVHVPIAGVALLSVLLGLPLVLLPVHILFLEFIIDPTVTIAFQAEPAEPDVMDRPPRDPRTSLYGEGMVLFNLGLGFVVLGAVAGLFLLSMREGASEALARSLTFSALVSANLALMLVSRSRTEGMAQLRGRPNPYLGFILLAAGAALAIALYVPPVASVFEFVPLPLEDLALALGVGVASGGWFELLKAWRGRGAPPRENGGPPPVAPSAAST